MTDQISMNTKFACSESILSTNIGDEFVMMSLDVGKYFSLKGASGRVWELIQSKRNVEAIHTALVSEYDVAPAQCEEELFALLGEMHDGKMISIVE